jgi:hypothetical protein
MTICSQILLNLGIGNTQFGYITKSIKNGVGQSWRYHQAGE